MEDGDDEPRLFTAKVEREMDRMEHFSSSLELLLHERMGKH